MSCNPKANKFNHILEQYLDYSNCKLECCDREIPCRKCKKNMLEIHDMQVCKSERIRIQEELKQCVQNGLIKIESGSEKLFSIFN